MPPSPEPPTLDRRRTGVLLHPTSLPGPHGIGDLGGEARRFAQWLRDAGATVWQMLPLVPTDPGLSPYSSWSAMATNPWLICLEDLVHDGLLRHQEIPTDALAEGRVDADAMRARKGPLIARAAKRLLDGHVDKLSEQFAAWRARSDWVTDAATFWALHCREQAPWWQWPEALRDRDPAALRQAEREVAETIEVLVAEQFLVHRQMAALRAWCNERGILWLGDVPVYVAQDSADVWSHRDLFDLDERGSPTEVAGVPPDYFSKTGQLWGNPLYDWSAPELPTWWLRRVQRLLEQADLVRIDHFRAFCAYWAIPAGSEDARSGRWRQGPGADFFEQLRASLGTLPLVAEDLGDIDDAVRDLLARVGLPGMHVLQFAFADNAANTHLPHNHAARSVAYTCTHDNNTTLGWWQQASEHERDHLRRYLGVDGHDVVWDLIRAALRSSASLAVMPAQDLLALPSQGRMNTPNTVVGNWTWRLTSGGLPARAGDRLRELSILYGRA